MGAGARSPALAWGPGVLGIAYVRDDSERAVIEVDRIVDGEPMPQAIEAGGGAARGRLGMAWSGEAFVFAWGEATELITEVYVGMVDAAGNVRWDASRLTETLRTGRWRTPERTAVASKDPRILSVAKTLVLSWRTKTFPDASPLYFATVSGPTVSSPVRVSGATDTVLDHQLVFWRGAPAVVYIGRFQGTQRLVRVARVGLSPPALLDDWMIAEVDPPPEWFEVSATAEREDLFVMWRTKTEWDTESNVAMARISPDAAAGASPQLTRLEKVRAATPPVHQPERSFATVPFADGVVVAWAVEGDPDEGDTSELRIGMFDSSGAAVGAPASVSTDVRLARDPALLRGAEGEIWYAFVYGEPPAEKGRILYGSVVCGIVE